MDKERLRKQETERFLIIKAQKGDRQSFRELFLAYSKRVDGVALGIMGQHDRAEEVTQEVFIRLYRSISNYDVKRNFFTYLYRITVNVCFDHLKKEKTRSTVSMNSEDDQFSNLPGEPMHNPHEKMEQKEIRRMIRKLVDRLGPKQRAAFILRDIEGLDSKEVADILKCSKTTVRAHLHFARKSLKHMIETEYPEFREA